MSRLPAAVLAAATALAGLAAAPAAHGATVAPGVACARVVSTVRTLPLNAAGFTPGALVRFSADDQLIGSAVADAAGNAQDVFFPPTLSSSTRVRQDFQVTADDGQGVVAGPVPLAVSRVTVELPARARPSKVVSYRARGFESGKVLWLHVRRGGRTRGSFKIGRARGACGDVSRRLRYMPLKRYTTGTYEYWFQASRRFDPGAFSYRASIFIFRTVRPR